MNKKGNAWATVAIVIVAAIVVAQYMGFDGKALFSAKGDETGTDTTTTKLEGFCPEDSVTVTFGPAINKLTAAALTNNIRAYVGETDLGSLADSATSTVGVGEKLKLIYNFGSATQHTDYAELVAPCKAFRTANYDMGAFKGTTYDTTITINAFNDENGLVNSITQNETINQGEEGGWEKIVVVTTADQGLYPVRAGDKYIESYRSPNGPAIKPGHWLAVLEFNGTKYDKSRITWQNPSGQAYTRHFYKPSFHSNIQTDGDNVAFEIPGCPSQADIDGGLRSCNLNTGRLRAAMRSGRGAQGGAVGVPAGDIAIHIYGPEWTRHTDTGFPIYGIEDDSGARMSQANQTITLFVEGV